MSEIAIKIENLRKQYRLGKIGGATLNAELQSWWARKRGKDDPNLKIGQTYSKVNESFWALDGINLQINKGEAIGIIGTNGAGKSTLLKILSRVTAPTEGDIWINGRVSSMLEVGTGFNGELTGRENIYMNGAILGMSKKEVDKKMDSIIEFSECAQFIDTPVKRYSSGMYTKLAFSVASSLDADILIMDEVLAVGDTKFQKKCLGKMGDVAEHDGKTVLYVSHNMSTIRNLCSRCIVLDKGKIIYDGDVEEAIEVYSRDASEKQKICYYEFKDRNRRSNLGINVRISSFEFIDCERAVFSNKERIRFRIKWSTNLAMSGLHARIVIKRIDSTLIGMSESGSIEASEVAKEYENIFEFDPAFLAEGEYFMTVSLNNIYEGGGYRMQDEVPVQIFFNIEETKDENVIQSTWINRYWGSIRFNPLKII